MAPNQVVRVIDWVRQRVHQLVQMVASLIQVPRLDLVHQILQQILPKSHQLAIKMHRE